MRKIELLAPAKDFAAAKSAIDFGADAVYIGGARFGARGAAANSTDDIRRVVEYAHLYGVKVYATFNTLIYDAELPDARREAEALVAAGVDALIVQDMAVRQMNLGVELHSSTQMNNMTAEQVAFMERCGFSRVVLERALSLAEIERICSSTKAEVECFVHGAICVGYSGRCFFSRSMSDRSGNRGECSQPCRLSYDLVRGQNEVVVKGKHLLSVRDFNLTRRVEELIDAGVTSLKIEGRLKSEDYIRNVVGHYNRVLNEIVESRSDLVRASLGRSVLDFEPNPAKSFTRGQSEYFIDGRQRGVASFDTPKAVGQSVGRVKRVVGRGFVLDNGVELASGDGLCFASADGFVGTAVNGVDRDGVVVPNKMDGIVRGTEIFRNFDARFTQSVLSSRTKRVLELSARLTIEPQCVRLSYNGGGVDSVEVAREGRFEAAQNSEKMRQVATQQIAKCGDTIFTVAEVAVDGAEWFVPSSLLAEMRREALVEMTRRCAVRPMQHKVLADDVSARYPQSTLTAECNVTNHLAREFYQAHGVEHIECGLDLERTTEGHTVLRSNYCIRREIGQCLKGKHTLTGDLYLQRGAMRYGLVFDCARCEMSIVHLKK